MGTVTVDLDPWVEEKFPPTHQIERSAEAMDMPTADFVQHMLYNIETLNVIDVKGKGAEPQQYSPVIALPGHTKGGPYGPRSADVMIIGKRPGFEEINRRRNLVGPAGLELSRVFADCGIDDSEFYATNVVRFIPPDGGKNLKAHHIKDCSTLLAHEISIVNPRFILLLGADAVKFMFGKKASLSSVRGAELTFRKGQIGTFPKRDTNDGIAFLNDVHGAKVVATINPAQVLREPELMEEFENDVRRFVGLVNGERSRLSVSAGEGDVKYQYISDASTLETLVNWLVKDEYKQFAVDCEWGGPNYREGWLRSIQFSWAAREAAVVHLHSVDKQPVFQPFDYKAYELLRRLFDRPGVQMIGHYFRADAPWLEDRGIPVMKHLYFDTLLADHLLNEHADHTLCPGLAIRHTDMGRYDFELQSWIKRHPGVVTKSRAYGDIPDELLLPYGGADADCTFRSFEKLVETLQRPENAAVAALLREISMPANQPIFEMEMNGLLADTDRMLDLMYRYDQRKKELLAELRDVVKMPSFNPRSFKQKAELLFGNPADGGLGLSPVKSTGKPAMEWSRVMELPSAERARMNPSTDAETLELLTADAPLEWQREVVGLVQKFQIIDQVTKNFLRTPKGYTEEQADNAQFDRNTFEKGLLSCVADDGRIRTRFSQTKETGRYGSSDPNLQNISKRQEPRYREIMGDDIPSIRSCFVAEPGRVLIEADFKSAEIVTLAYVSGDKNLIADALGPVKLHAKVAVDILGAPCSYEEVAEKHPHLYVGAKNINFGIPYQRGAKAIARQVNRETKGKANMTQDGAQALIDAWYTRYHGVADYVGRCKYSVRHAPHYIQTPYGRRRHFSVSPEESVMAAQEREGVNFSIQSIVAETLSKALFNLWQFKQDNPWCDYQLLLAIHDAAMASVAIEHIEVFMEHVLPLCMVHGARVPELGFTLGIDKEIMLRWGEHPSRAALEARGVPEKYLPEE